MAKNKGQLHHGVLVVVWDETQDKHCVCRVVRIGTEVTGTDKVPSKRLNLQLEVLLRTEELTPVTTEGTMEAVLQKFEEGFSDDFFFPMVVRARLP